MNVKTDVKTRLEPEGSSTGLSDPDQPEMARVCSCSCDSDRDRGRDGVRTRDVGRRKIAKRCHGFIDPCRLATQAGEQEGKRNERHVRPRANVPVQRQAARTC